MALDVLKSIASNWIKPVPIILVMVLIGLLFVRISRTKYLGVRIIAGAALILAFASWAPVAEKLLETLEVQYPAVTDYRTLPQVEAIVVLGADWAPNAAWSVSSQLNPPAAVRLMEGLRLYHALSGVRLILSGGSRESGVPPIAQGYAVAARELGVPAERIFTLDEPLNTSEEAYAVLDLLGPATPFLLVTSASHMPRAMKHFQQVGLVPIPAPTYHQAQRTKRDNLSSWLPNSSALRMTEMAWHEYLGLLAWRWDHPG